MAILVMGRTGQIGSLVVGELAKRGADVRALATKKPRSSLPARVQLVLGDVMDVDLMRDVLRTVSTVFVLSPAVPDELARVLLILSLIEEAGFKRIVYFSMMGSNRFIESSRDRIARVCSRNCLPQRSGPAIVCIGDSKRR